MSEEMDSEESTTSGIAMSEQNRAGVSHEGVVGSPIDGSCKSVVGAGPLSEDSTPHTHNTVTITSLDERSDQSELTNAAKCSGSGCEESLIIDEVMDVGEEKEDESEDDLQLSFTDMEYQQAPEDSDSLEDSVDDIRDVAGADEKQVEGSVEGSSNTRRSSGANSNQEEVPKPYYQDYTIPPNDERSWAAITQEDKELELKEGSLSLDAEEDQELMKDLVAREEREVNPEMVHEDETEEEIAERVRNAEVRLEGVENELFYKPCTDKFPRHATLRAVAKVDQKRIGEFVLHAQEQLQAHDYHIHENEATGVAQLYSVQPPSSRSIICSVVEIRGTGSVVLTPVHLEVVAGRRFDLQFLFLMKGSFDVHSKKFFEIRDFQEGDLVWVDTIVPIHGDHRKPMVTSVEDIDNKSKHYFWKVKIATVLPRIILKGKFARRFKSTGPRKFTYLCEEVDFPAKMDRNLKNNPQVRFQDWMTVDVMVPMILPGINVRDFSPKPEDEKEARNLFNSHYPTWDISPTILVAHPLNKREEEKIMRGVNQFSDNKPATQDEFLWLSDIVRIAAWCEAAIANTRYDPRHYPAMVLESDDTVYGDTLKLQLEYPKHLPVKVKNWNRNTPVSVRVKGEYISGIVLSALDYKEEGFFVMVKVTTDLEYGLETYVDEEAIITHVRQEVDDMIRTQIGKLRPPEYSINQPAMDAIVACHGGEPVKEGPFARTKRSFQFGTFTSTRDQGVVYSMLLDAGIPAILLDCCFGAGKTSTLVASMCKLISNSTNDQVQWHIITGQSNGAVTQAVKSWIKIDREKIMRVVRIITPANRSRIDTACQTPFDLPVMLWEVLKDAFNRYNFRGMKQNELSICIARHLFNKRKIGSTREINNKELRKECLRSFKKHPPSKTIMECFLQEYQPNIIFGTTASLRQAFVTNNYLRENKHRVPVIMVDEASILPRSSILALAYTFPQSRLLLAGDVKQLPPHSEPELPKDLRDAVSGPLFESIINTKALPVVSVKECFRCPPPLTQVISMAFYDGSLIPRKRWDDRDSITRKFRLGSRFPLKFINTASKDESEGTSCRNLKEALITKNIVLDALKKGISPNQIMVICYYLAQASLVSAMLPKDVRVSTVDASQGSEYQLVIVLTSRSSSFDKSDFLDKPQRMTVALSRATEGCICLFNYHHTKRATNWSNLLKHVPPREIIDVKDTDWRVNLEQMMDLQQRLKAAEEVGHSIETIGQNEGEDSSRKRKRND